MTTTVGQIDGEIDVDLMEDIIKSLPKLTPIYSIDHSILIHGMGGQTRGFYNDIRQKNQLNYSGQDGVVIFGGHIY